MGRLAVVVAVVIAAAGVSTPAQARTAADPRPAQAQTGPGPQLTGLAARVLTRPSAVRGTDGRLHIAYELVLTGATPFAVDVEQVEVRDAKTHRVLLSLSGDALSSRMNPVGGAPAGVTPPPTTLIGPSIAASCDFRTRGSPRGGRGREGRAEGPELPASWPVG